MGPETFQGIDGLKAFSLVAQGQDDGSLTGRTAPGVVPRNPALWAPKTPFGDPLYLHAPLGKGIPGKYKGPLKKKPRFSFGAKSLCRRAQLFLGPLLVVAPLRSGRTSVCVGGPPHGSRVNIGAPQSLRSPRNFPFPPGNTISGSYGGFPPGIAGRPYLLPVLPRGRILSFP